MLKIVCLIACLATISMSASAQNNNLYLPPTEPGYDYPKPPGQTKTTPKPGGPKPPPSSNSNEPHEPGMPFDFNYAVNDIDTSNANVNYDHKSNSDGDITQGEYRVQLPDGRTQVVKYTADWKNGYNAEVSYE